MIHEVKFRLTLDNWPSDPGSILFKASQTRFIRVITAGKILKLHLASHNDVSDYMKPECLQELQSAGLTLITSPETRAECTVVARGVDKHIREKSDHEIIAETSASNNVKIEEIFRVPNTPIIKFRCSSPTEANKLLKSGINLFFFVIPSSNLERARFLKIQQCFRCYGYDHTTHKCQKQQICSKCAVTGHFHKSCSSTSLRCCNCAGDHEAVSRHCPIRISHFEDAKQKAIHSSSFPPLNPVNPQPPSLNPPQKTNNTYAQALLPTPSSHPFPALDLDRPTKIKISQIIQIARSRFPIIDHDFQNRLNEGFTANSLPTVTIPASWHHPTTTPSPPILTPHARDPRLKPRSTSPERPSPPVAASPPETTSKASTSTQAEHNPRSKTRRNTTRRCSPDEERSRRGTRGRNDQPSHDDSRDNSLPSRFPKEVISAFSKAYEHRDDPVSD